MARALLKTVVMPMTPVRTPAEFLSSMGSRDAFRIDSSGVTNEDAIVIAAWIGDWITDCGDVWTDSSIAKRLDYAREFVSQCQAIEAHGFRCFMGSHRQQRRMKNLETIILNVGVMMILPKDGPDKRYAMIELEGAWENLEQDKVKLD